MPLAIDQGEFLAFTPAVAGAVSRFNMGLVIATGLTIGTLFTLFMVPAAYVMIGANHAKRVEGEEVLTALGAIRPFVFGIIAAIAP